MAIKDDYYDIDVELQNLFSGETIMELFYLKDLQQRKMFLNDEIDSSTVADIIRHIFQFNKEDAGLPPESRKPILLYVTSRGGELDAGFGLIDAIMCSKTPVYTINTSFQYSMGFLIGLAGHRRFATPNAKYLMHDGSNFVYNSGAKAQDQMEFQKRIERRVREYVLTRSNVTPEEYDGKLRVEWYLFADEAKEKGFVDEIIGVDCDIDSVI